MPGSKDWREMSIYDLAPFPRVSEPRLSDQVVAQFARVWCLECGKPSIYPDTAFFAHYETHYEGDSWAVWWSEQRKAFHKRFRPFTYYTEYAYREDPYRQEVT